MEEGLISIFGNLGIAGIGFYFAYYILKQKFQSDSNTSKEIARLCEKIDKLVEVMYKLSADNAQSFSKSETALNEYKEGYSKISAKISDNSEKQDAIYLTVHRIYDKINNSMRLGSILVAKGIITQAQLDEALEEQKNYN